MLPTVLKLFIFAGTRTFQPWVLHSVAKLKLFQLSSLDNAIVAFGGVKVSAFARDSGEIFLDSFDDSVIMVSLNSIIFLQQFFSSGFFFSCVFSLDQPGYT